MQTQAHQRLTAAIRNILTSGYTITDITDSYITVLDPVQCSSGGGKRWAEYNKVDIYSDLQASKFIVDRS